MTSYVDLNGSAEEARKLFTMEISSGRRRQAVSDFVEHTRRQLTDLFRPYDPEHAQSQSAHSV